MKYTFFSDPSHGWLKVSVDEILLLGIQHRITKFSYFTEDRKWVYLEEDQDATTFENAAVEAGWYSDIKELHEATQNRISNFSSFIRNLVHYQPQLFAAPLSKTFEL